MPDAVVNARRPFPVVRVSLLFSLLVLVFNLLQWLVLIPDNMLQLQLVTARLTAWLVAASGLPLTLAGVEIFLGNSHWEVTPECTALSAVFVFLAFVLVYPTSFRAKLKAVLVGIPFLFVANISRLFGLAWVSHLLPQQVDLFHDYVWQVVFLLLVVLMWLAWIDWCVRHEN